MSLITRLGLLAALALMLPVVLFVAGLTRDLLGPKLEAFDSEGWRAAPHSLIGRARRKRMYPDLIAKHPLIGLERTALESILGPPDRNPYLLVEQPRHAGAHIYRLGPNFTDDDWLVIRFDAQAKAVSADVVSD
jgi:hypothetical protein